jgi:hypothetical protein
MILMLSIILSGSIASPRLEFWGTRTVRVFGFSRTVRENNTITYFETSPPASSSDHFSLRYFPVATEAVDSLFKYFCTSAPSSGDFR